jgi:hypothetical protein
MRGECLLQAHKTINKDRQDQYGNAEDNFGMIAQLWSVYLDGKYPDVFPALLGSDVAMMMALLKVARIATGKYNDDNYVDLCGYAALADGMDADVEAQMEGFVKEVEKDLPKSSKIFFRKVPEPPLVKKFMEQMEETPLPDLHDITNDYRSRRDSALQKFYGEM